MPFPSNLRLSWNDSWPERLGDFSGRDPGNKDMLARIFSVHHGPIAGDWFWTVADGRELGSGYAADRNSAAKMAERAYFTRDHRPSDARSAAAERGANHDPFRRKGQ